MTLQYNKSFVWDYFTLSQSMGGRSPEGRTRSHYFSRFQNMVILHLNIPTFLWYHFSLLLFIITPHVVAYFTVTIPISFSFFLYTKLNFPLPTICLALLTHLPLAYKFPGLVLICKYSTWSRCDWITSTGQTSTSGPTLDFKGIELWHKFAVTQCKFVFYDFRFWLQKKNRSPSS